MVKVITYGTYDLLHYGHIRLLERAKALGDYLIVGVTADDFDKTRGKINVQQSLIERVEAVKATGIADEIIIEEYEGQKIDDIQRLEIDIFTVGSDWVGKFDYLKDYCKVVYLERTIGVSSSEIRSDKREVCIGMIGEIKYLKKFLRESRFVNGASVVALLSSDCNDCDELSSLELITDDYDKFFSLVDAVYIISNPILHYEQIKKAILAKKHVLCEAPLTLQLIETKELHILAEKNEVILVEGLKTAYSTAYSRLLLLVKSGIIGDVVSVDATCTSLRENEYDSDESASKSWSSITAWGTVALLPVFQILGSNFQSRQIVSRLANTNSLFDIFTRITFIYPTAVASIKVGKGIKSEGELIITGTEGYIFVPAPWWKTDYFEIRFENPEKNKRYFYQLEGEGIRYMIVAFLRSISSGRKATYIQDNVSEAIAGILEDFYQKKNIQFI